MPTLTGLYRTVEHLRPLRFPRETERYIAPRIDSATARVRSEKLDHEPPSDWQALVGYEEMTQAQRGRPPARPAPAPVAGGCPAPYTELTLGREPEPPHLR